MTPLERAARALYAHTPHVVEWDGLSQSAKNANIAAARAVFEAIREPSEEMAEVGGDYFDTAIPIEVEGLWQAMIDAALAEGA